MYKNIVVIPPCLSYGDTLSAVSLLFFLQQYYERVHFFLGGNHILFRYYTHFFHCHPCFNTRIFLMMSPDQIQAEEYDEYHICNLHTGDWTYSPDANYLLSKHSKIAPEHYFCDRRPLYELHAIDPQYLSAPNTQLPLETVQPNSVVYYKMVGLNAHVRLDFFDYMRDSEKEAAVKQGVLAAMSIPTAAAAKYNVMCSSNISPEIAGEIRQRAGTATPMIDLHYLVEFPGWLFSLIEGAEEIHLVEGSNTNLIYFAQHTGTIRIAHLPVYYHIWARQRRSEAYKLDWYWKMADEPRHPNWEFVYV